MTNDEAFNIASEIKKVFALDIDVDELASVIQKESEYFDFRKQNRIS